jgi:mono/diheme cytochrome c family protein
VFTVAQATRGREVYTNACARCHMTTQHSGATFASTWNNRRVFDLYDILVNTMPLDDPGSLSEQEYVDVVAYILQINGHPAGKAALPNDPTALKGLRIDVRPVAAP